eukprot:TRINITY_DN4539_c0_g1_i1.p1 TRINITY_DN4539_c0_g1~~TRINITY_DN4539_c0_g1_i1.p1  ORF type:complete len:706 (+),score=93.48 TRINITY_DN4539_c0_g1_i1:51-2168(+)
MDGTPHSPTEVQSHTRRLIDWVVLGIGSAVYLSLFVIAIISWRVKKKGYYPLLIRYVGLTYAVGIGGFLWFVAQISERQLLLQDDVLAPSTLNCWIFSLLRYLGMAIFFNSLITKHYKQYKKYVEVERSSPSWLIVLCLSCPFIIFMSVPASGLYHNVQVNSETDLCGTPNVMWHILSCYVAALLIPSGVLINSLRDPSVFFPNYRITLVELIGMTFASMTLVAMSWSCDASEMQNPSVVVSVHTLVGTIFTPAALFIFVFAEPLYKYKVKDAEYVYLIEEKMRVHEALPSLTENPEDRLPFAPVRSQNYALFEIEHLAECVESGVAEEVKKYLAQTNLLNINVPDKEGMTPLHRAIRNRNIEIAELLLDLEASPNVVDGDGLYPIHIASRRGHVEGIFLLHQFGADVNASTMFGVTALHIAIEYRQMGAIALLLRLGSDVLVNSSSKLQCPDPWNWDEVHVNGRGWMRSYHKTPFILACEFGYKDIVCFLIETSEVKADSPCNHGWTPLQLCCALGHDSIVEYLLSLPDEQTKLTYENPRDKRNAFHYAAIFGKHECLKKLIRHFYDSGASPPRHRAAASKFDIQTSQQNSGDIAASILSSNSSDANVIGIGGRRRAQLDSLLNAQDYMGRTPLHYSVIGGHVQATRQLLSENADTCTPDFTNMEPKDISQPLIITTAKGLTAAEYSTLSAHTQIKSLFEKLSS